MALLLLVVPWLAGCGAAEKGGADFLLYTFRGSTMGTYFVAKVVKPEAEALSEPEQEAMLALIEATLEGVNGRMSTYQDDSELMLFNRSREAGPFPLSADTVEVLREALTVGDLTGGALDITIGPLVNAYGFGPPSALASTDEPPRLESETLEGLRARVGLGHLGVSAEGEEPAATKALPELFVDLSSLAKGYGVDRVIEALLAEGHEDLMVEVGGEARTAGLNLERRPWRLGIERPSEGRGVQRIVSLENAALATSGDYRNYREVEGVRISHLVDPRTGLPIGHRLASVTVIHESCMRADALATALMVLGPDEGYDLATEHDLAVLFLVREGEGFEERATPRFPASTDTDRSPQ